MKDKEGFDPYFIFSLNSFVFQIDKFRGFAFLTFDDYDSVDRCILEKPHIINGKELDIRKAIPREQTSSRINGFILNHNPHLNNDFYQSHLMIHHPTLPPPPYTPYAYYPPSNYLSKPMPLMGTTNPSTFFFPPELANSAFFRNQTFPSPPPSITSSGRTNNNNKSTNDQVLISDDSSKNLFTTGIANYSTPIRSKPRYD
jgi:hypothetical protein